MMSCRIRSVHDGAAMAMPFFFLVMALLSPRLSSAAPQPGEKLVFNDEFDELNLEIWEHEITLSGEGKKVFFGLFCFCMVFVECTLCVCMCVVVGSLSCTRITARIHMFKMVRCI